MPLPIELQQTYQVSSLAIHIAVALEMTKRRSWDEPSLFQTTLIDNHLFGNSLCRYFLTLYSFSLSDSNPVTTTVLNGDRIKLHIFM